MQAAPQDFIAGLTVALVLIPQSMAMRNFGRHALLLHGSTPPLSLLMIAALFGSSRQLATGPVAVVSLMTAASLAPLATAGSEGYIAYALLLSLIVGLPVFPRRPPPRPGRQLPVASGGQRFYQCRGHYHCHFATGKRCSACMSTARNITMKPSSRYVKARCISPTGPDAYHRRRRLCPHVRTEKRSRRRSHVLVAVALTTVISGHRLQHDTKTDVSAIQSAKTRELVTAFNDAMLAKPEFENRPR